jgi:hypothetical protein
MAKGSRTPPKSSPETDPENSGSMTADEAAAYIFQVTGELAAIARRAQLEHLAYLLEMAKLEAGDPSRKPLDRAA